MLGKIIFEAGVEGVLADFGDELGEEAGALGVDDGAVEEGLDFVGAVDILADGLDAGQEVALHGVGAFVEVEVLHDFPLGEEGVDTDVFDVGGEGFVEPEVVPPAHGDEIAEPLVGDFVGDDKGDAFFGFEAGVGGGEEEAFAVGDEAPVFHGAGLEVGEGDLVKLGEGVADLEFVDEEVEGADGDVASEGEVGDRVVGGGVGGDFGLVLGGGRDGVEAADDKGEEVGAHGRGFVEGGADALVFELEAGDDGGVAKGAHERAVDEDEVELGLGLGLVDAGEDIAGIVAFKLGGDDFASGAGGGLVGGVVGREVGAGHFAGDGAGPSEA